MIEQLTMIYWNNQHIHANMTECTRQKNNQSLSLGIFSESFFVCFQRHIFFSLHFFQMIGFFNHMMKIEKIAAETNFNVLILYRNVYILGKLFAANGILLQIKMKRENPIPI